MSKAMAEIETVKSKIYTVRGIKVMLDRDLADLYQVETRRLNEQVKRNSDRFPSDFIFQLNKDEVEEISRSQNAILKQGQNIKYLPYAFTEQGVAMVSGILKSKVAVQVNIQIMRAFVELRRAITSNPEYEVLRQTVKHIESRMDTIESNHLVDRIQLAGKVTQLSRDVQDIREDVHKMSELFDQFQNAHIVIKRPEEGSNKG